MREVMTLDEFYQLHITYNGDLLSIFHRKGFIPCGEWIAWLYSHKDEIPFSARYVGTERDSRCTWDLFSIAAAGSTRLIRLSTSKDADIVGLLHSIC